MDWFTIGTLAVLGGVAIIVAWWATRASTPRRTSPGDRERTDTLEREHDDIKRGTSPEASGL